MDQQKSLPGVVLRAGPIAALAVLVVLAALIRVAGIDFGRPFAYHSDEWAILRPAMNMVDFRDWAPHVYWYPSGWIDVQAVVVGVARLLGGPTLETGQGWLMPWEFLPSQFHYLLAGRLLGMIVGVATVAAVFWTGRLLAGNGAGLAAAAVLAAMPLHVEHSRYLTTDVPVAFVCTLTLAMTFVASRRRRMRYWIVAGALAGIAGGIKWNGLAILVVPVMGYVVGAPTIRDAFRRERLVTPVLVSMAAVLMLLLTTPAIIFDAPAVADYLRLQVTGYAAFRFGRPENGLAANVTQLMATLGPVGLAAACGGLIAMIVRPANRVEWTIPLFSVMYLVVASLPALHYARNLLPILPFLAIAVGVGAARGATWLGRRFERRTTKNRIALPAGRSRWLATAPFVLLVGLVLAMASSTSLSEARRLTLADTRTIAREWMLDHLPSNTRVAREIYTPQLQPNEFLFRGHEYLMRRDWEWYRSTRTDVLVASSGAYSRFVGNPDTPAQDRFYSELFALPEIFRVDPGPDRSGPTIRIFALSDRATLVREP
jgi:hypothetical protein